MYIKNVVVVMLSKGFIGLLRIFNSGATNLPGKIAMKLYPKLLTKLANQIKIIFVTGTNGKTTTTKILSEIFTANNKSFITNKSGANLTTGIFTALLNSCDRHGKLNYEYGLFEIDEAAFSEISTYVSPSILIVTNFFRDQLDRFGELYTTINKVKDGIKRHPDMTLILNADDSLSVYLQHNLKNKTIYFGLSDDIVIESEQENCDAPYCILCKTKYTYKTNFYGHLGYFKCPNCGYKRPKSDITVQKIDTSNILYSVISFSSLDSNAINENIRINLPGIYNIYNAIAAYAGASVLQFETDSILNIMTSFSNSFGRMETIKIKNKEIKLILVKNPTGYNQVLRYLKQNTSKYSVAMLLNDKSADGTDISWIWDVNFELLENIQANISHIYTSGIRADDMFVRLKYAGIYTNKIKLLKDYNKLLDESIENLKQNETLYILPTYTCMLAVRKILCTRYNLKKFWE